MTFEPSSSVNNVHRVGSRLIRFPLRDYGGMRRCFGSRFPSPRLPCGGDDPVLDEYRGQGCESI